VRLLAAARSASGSDDALLGAIDILEAKAWLHAGQWNRYKTAYADALEVVARARRHFEAIGDVRRTAMAFALEAEIYFERADERALDDAMFAARQAADMLEREQRPPLEEMDELRARIAFMRRDLNEAHRRFDGDGSHWETSPLPTITGRVTGAQQDQTVTLTAWSGVLRGDRSRVITDINDLVGETAQANPDGTFSIKANAGTFIVAEAKGLRSKPVRATKTPMTIQLEPTTTISGSVVGPNLMDVKAFARYDLAEHTGLVVRAPVDRDATFDLAGLLPGLTPQLGLEGPAGDGIRTVLAPDAKNMRWPAGQAVEVIVRGKIEHTPVVYVLRGRVEPMSVRDLEGRLPATIQVARCFASPVGANNTDAGREMYQAGDYHCTITGNESGDISACAVLRNQARCELATIEPTVEVPYPDGRYGAGVTPVVVAF
jgi:hypothetical protein